MAYSIYHDLEINESIAKTFQAITEPKHLVNWWPLKCTGVPKQGEAYNFYFTPEYDWYGTVSKIEENETFHIKMTKSHPDWDPTTFGFDLEQKKGTTQVKFWHEGWPECNAHFRRSSFCWAMLLNGLKDYVEHGKIIPFDERE